MSWAEFCILLTGIMPETPLGQIVSIRSEENEDVMKNFTPEQHKIRNEWRMRIFEKNQKNISEMTDEEKAEQVKNIQEIFKRAFS
jgi:hypothetical protein